MLCTVLRSVLLVWKVSFFAMPVGRNNLSVLSGVEGSAISSSNPWDSQQPCQHLAERVSLNHPYLLWENVSPVLVPCVDIVRNPELVLGILVNLKQRTLIEVKVWELRVWVNVENRRGGYHQVVLFGVRGRQGRKGEREREWEGEME